MSHRKQATVMFTDVVGFTSLMERSEDKAMSVLSQKMEIVRKVVASRGGRIVKEMGDGTLSVFSHAPDAVSSALDIQDSLCSRNFKVRIGIHCGSVLFEGEDIFGDTVNVASRLENKAPGGGILLSHEVLSQYKESDRPETVDMGLTRLKGLGRLLQIHFLGLAGVFPEKMSGISPAVESGPLVLSVFPLVNIGGADDEFYAYGISADLLSDLSKANSLSVVPLTSIIKSMQSGESKDDIARRFGSSSFVQGTIERVSSQMKLSLTLKEVESGRTVWTDTWTEELDDLPALKGKLAEGILKALGRSPDKYQVTAEVESTSTYEKYLHAAHLWQTKRNKRHIQQARNLLKLVIDREPGMIPARLMLGATYRDSGEFMKGLEIFQEAQKIAQDGNNSSDLLSIKRSIGVSHWMRGDLNAAMTACNEAMKLAKQLHNRTEEASLLNNIGLIDCDRSFFSESLIKLQKSLDMSRALGSRTGQAHSLCNIGLVHWRSGNGTKAIEFYNKSLQIIKIIRDRTGEANLLTNIGIIYNDHGDIEQSYSTVSKSMKLSEELNDKCGICRALNNMGNAMLALGQNEKAEEHFSRALLLERQIGVRNIEGILLTNSAVVKLRAGDLSGAEKLFQTSLEISREIDDKEGIIENSWYVAEILRNRSELPEALDLLQHALHLCETYQLSRSVASIRTDLALCLIQSGTAIKEVLEHLKSARKTKTENEKILPDIYWKWSMIYTAVASNPDLLPNDCEMYRKKAAEWKKSARNEILHAADRIQSEEFRQSFLYQIPLHKTILSAFVTESFQEFNSRTDILFALNGSG